MWKVIGVIALLLLSLVVYPLIASGSDDYKVARQFALASEIVTQGAGVNAGVLYMLPGRFMSVQGGEKCASYRMLFRGEAGMQWIGVQIFTPAPRQPWRLIRQFAGMGGTFDKFCEQR